MRPLGVTDTIFFNLGDRYITGVALLEGRCDLARFAAEMDAATLQFEPLRERIVRIWPWFFAFPYAAFDIREHITVVDDPAVTERSDLLAFIDKVRRTKTRAGIPPWRVFVLNPAPAARRANGSTNGNGSGNGSGNDSGNGAHRRGGGQDRAPPRAPQPLSAVVYQLKHGLADAMRSFQVLGRLGRETVPPGRYRNDEFEHLNRAEFDALAEHSGIMDSSLSLIEIPRPSLRQDKDAATRLSDAAVALLAEADLFDPTRTMKGQIARTRLMRRHAGESLGNHLETVAEPVQGAVRPPAPPRWRIPGLEKAQSLPIAKYAVALAPPPLARAMMRTWYASFDAMITILPSPPNLKVGGRAVRAVFGAAPLSGPIPLLLLVTANRRNHNVVAITGDGFLGDKQRLVARLTALLTGRSGESGKPAAPRVTAKPRSAASAEERQVGL